jgi:hypothetical protein
MAYEMKELSGSLFKNQKREKDTHPNANGSALIDGVEYWVSAWTKKDKNGDPWQSLAFKRKDERPERQESKRRSDEDSDSIPF